MSRKRRPLSKEDTELWERVKGSATPLHPIKPLSELPMPKSVEPARDRKTKPNYAIPNFAVGSNAANRDTTHDLQPVLRDRFTTAPVNMDQKAFTKMKRGKLSPEARIDLHGLTLAQAHPRLISFILQEHAAGARLVLVITGKGKSKPDEGPIPTRMGVLKHQVPQWLSMPPLAGLVLQVTPSHRSHGGEGAYYVYLRRNR